MMSKDKLAQVFHFDLYGKREDKYNFLNESSLDSMEWTELGLDEPNYFFAKKDFNGRDVYEKGFKLSDLFSIYGMGITSGNDNKLIAFQRGDLENKFNDDDKILPIAYRTFDVRFIYYEKAEVERGRESLMRNFLIGNNIGLTCLKNVRNDLASKIGLVTKIVDKSIISTLDNGYVFPLYLYPETNNQLSIGESQNRVPNFNMDIVNQIAKHLDINFEPEKNVILEEYLEGLPWYFGPLDLLDYIYGILHSPNYREKYKEFLKIDFPRVPFPTSKRMFFMVKHYGGKLRELHLLESPEVENYITQYPIDGDNVVVKPSFSVIASETTQSATDEKPEEQTAQHQTSRLPHPDGIRNDAQTFGKVFINKTQYFDNVPKTAWEFYIGGYQPAQKWLKDRKGRELSFEDIMHYQKIIVALTKTADLMLEIDGVLVV